MKYYTVVLLWLIVTGVTGAKRLSNRELKVIRCHLQLNDIDFLFFMCGRIVSTVDSGEH